jgi:hypothetical protein
MLRAPAGGRCSSRHSWRQAASCSQFCRPGRPPASQARSNLRRVSSTFNIPMTWGRRASGSSLPLSVLGGQQRVILPGGDVEAVL